LPSITIDLGEGEEEDQDEDDDGEEDDIQGQAVPGDGAEAGQEVSQ
jgi:hypothetical protein